MKSERGGRERVIKREEAGPRFSLQEKEASPKKGGEENGRSDELRGRGVHINMHEFSSVSKYCIVCITHIIMVHRRHISSFAPLSSPHLPRTFSTSSSSSSGCEG